MAPGSTRVQSKPSGAAMSTHHCGTGSVRASIVSGGVLCVLGVGATAVWLRDFWRYDDRTDEHAVHERLVRAERGEAP